MLFVQNLYLIIIDGDLLVISAWSDSWSIPLIKPQTRGPANVEIRARCINENYESPDSIISLGEVKSDNYIDENSLRL